MVPPIKYGIFFIVASLLTSLPMALPQLVIVSSAAEMSLSDLGDIRGDFNGDGYEDLAIGVPLEDIGSITDAGAVNVFYGSASGLQTGSPSDQFWHQNKAGVEDSSEANDQFGSSLAQGDFDGDGFGDLAIGVYEESVGSQISAGAVHVLYGSSSGLRTSAAGDGTGRADQFWHENKPGVNGIVEANDRFGEALAAGDYNGDGRDDLAIGVWLQTVEENESAGSVLILYGSDSGLQTTSPADRLWTHESVGIKSPTGHIDGFGHLLASGNFNGDGYDDLAIGTYESLNDVTSGGAVRILYGSSSGLQANSPDDQLWHPESPESDIESGSSAGFSSSLAVGDFNADGNDDLVIGDFIEQIDDDGDSDGAIHVLYGSPSGLQTSLPQDQFWHNESPELASGGTSFDGSFGTSIAAGDFNNDGYFDLAIGVPHENLGSTGGAGIVRILYGSPAGLQATGTDGPNDQIWHQDSPGINDSAQTADHFGQSLQSGDFNNDGKDDLAVGVLHEKIGTFNNAGAVNVIFGSASGLQSSSPSDQFWHQNVSGVDDSSERSDHFGLLGSPDRNN